MGALGGRQGELDLELEPAGRGHRSPGGPVEPGRALRCRQEAVRRRQQKDQSGGQDEQARVARRSHPAA